MDKILKIFLLTMIVFINILIFDVKVFAVSAPTLNQPVSGFFVPYYHVFIKWYDASYEKYYLVSLRDLTTNTLLINRTKVNQNTTYYQVNWNLLSKGHKYRWAVASVDSTGKEYWSQAEYTIESANPDPHLFLGGFSFEDGKHLDYWISANNQWYGDNILKAGVNSWNGITNSVFAHHDSYADKYEFGIMQSSTDIPGVLGSTRVFSNGIEVPITSNNAWTWAEIRIYDNQLNQAGATNNQKIATVIHEMGHVLSLAHTNDINTSFGSTEVMDQGLAKPTSTTDIDRTHLRLIWGWN